MGKIYARLINKYIEFGIDTGYTCIGDVKEKYRDATREAYFELFGEYAPE